MRQSNRTPQCRNLLSVLHASRLPSSYRRPLTPPKHNRHPISTDFTLLHLVPPCHLRRQTLMGRMHTSILSKNTPLRRPPMAPQSPRRSPSCRLDNSCRRLTETRRIRYNANYNHTRPPLKGTQLPIYYFCPMRGYYDGLNLSSTDRPKVPHCLLLSKPHRPSGGCNSHPNTMKLHRGAHSYNCPRTDIFGPLLSRKHELRANPQPNNSPGPRLASSVSLNSNLMVYR